MAHWTRRRIALLLVLPLAGLLFGEFTIRAVLHVKHGVPGKSLGRWESDPVLGARMARSVYDHRMETNDAGFRGDEDLIRERPAGALRILAYGGSTTLCWNVGTEESWPRQLEVRLREESTEPAHQVLNAGDINWSIGHVLARARTEIPELQPDAVILYSGINEVINARLLSAGGMEMSNLVERGEYGRVATNLPQSSWWAQHSFLFRAFQGRVLRPILRARQGAGHDPWYERQRTRIGPEAQALPPDPALLANYLHILRELATIVRESGSELVFVVQARGWDSVALEHFTSYSRVAAPTAGDLGAIVIDAQAALPPDPSPLFYDSGIHFSESGCRWFADLLYGQYFAERLRRPGVTAPAGTE